MIGAIANDLGLIIEEFAPALVMCQYEIEEVRCQKTSKLLRIRPHRDHAGLEIVTSLGGIPAFCLEVRKEKDGRGGRSNNLIYLFEIRQCMLAGLNEDDDYEDTLRLRFGDIRPMNVELQYYIVANTSSLAHLIDSSPASSSSADSSLLQQLDAAGQCYCNELERKL